MSQAGRSWESARERDLISAFGASLEAHANPAPKTTTNRAARQIWKWKSEPEISCRPTTHLRSIHQQRQVSSDTSFRAPASRARARSLRNLLYKYVSVKRSISTSRRITHATALEYVDAVPYIHSISFTRRSNGCDSFCIGDIVASAGTQIWSH